MPETVNVVGASASYDSSTGAISLSDPTGNVTITAVCEVAIDPVFGNNSWANIRNAVRSGNVPNTWAVGDTKSVTLTNNTTMTVRIADMTTGRYDFADNSSNKSNMVIEFVECFANTAPMNTTETNVGGWADSAMRSTTMPACLALLPQDMQDAMSEVLVLSGIGGGNTGSTSSSANKLFLPCEYEIFGGQKYSVGVSESPKGQFEYYITHNTQQDHVKRVGETEETWWLRGTYASNLDSSFFCSIHKSGIWNINNSTTLNGVSPVFAI